MRPSSAKADELEKKNFYLSTRLVKKIEKVASERDWNFSEFVRFAIEEVIKRIEEERINREIEEACKFYYGLDKEIAEDWRAAEAGV